MHCQIVLIICLLTIKSTVSSSDSSQSAGDAQVIVKGIVGQSARLSCHVDHSCGELYLITWTKLESKRDDQWTLIYIYGPPVVDKPMGNLSGRAKFGNKNSTDLIINQLKSGDESLYKCDVTYVTGKCPSLTFVQLDIIAKPSRVSIEYNSSHVESGSEISGTEGDQMKLSCIVEGGKPAPVVSWRRIDAEGNIQIVEIKNSSLSDDVTKVSFVRQLSRTDLKAKYECHVEHEAVKNSAINAFVVMDINVGAESVEIVGPSSDIKEGDMTVMQCIAFASKPETTITWRNGSQIIDSRNARIEIESNDDGTVNTRSFIELLVSRFDHLTTIDCQAINIAMKQPKAQSIELRIQYAPTVVMEPQNGLSVNESAYSVNIYCPYDANPSELIENATWFKDDHELLIYNDSSHYINQPSGYPMLTIVNPTRKDAGTYYCSVANLIGRGKPDSGIALTVLYPPSVRLEIHPDPSLGLMIKEGDDIRLICDIIDGNPQNATKYKWIKNDEFVSETSQKEIMWRNVARNLTANYSCVAISDAGASQMSNYVDIDVNYRPGKAFIRQLNGMFAVKSNNVSLECIARDLGKPLAAEYLWENNGTPYSNERSAILHISNIALKDRGNISCAAINANGLGSKGYFELTPYAPPKMIDNLPQTSGALYNASYYNASCRVECFPICNITWKMDNQAIDSNSSQYQIKTSIHPEELEDNLFMSAVSTLIWNMSALSPTERERHSKLKYSCVSSENEVGAAVQSDMYFFTEYAPVCTIYEEKEGDNIALVCDVVSANPDNSLVFTWTLNNETLNETIATYVVNEQLKSRVTFPHNNDNLFGNWSCTVRNVIGESERNCTILVQSSPSVIPKWTPLDDVYILVISSIIAALIITFIVILLVLICLMRRRRHKESHQVSQTRENPDGSRSPTPSSVSSQLSSNQVITYKKVEMNPRLKRNDKVIDSSHNGKPRKSDKERDPSSVESGNREMYENMPFQRKCMLLSGAFIPQYENIAQITKELRRTQSARYHYQPFQPFDTEDILYADMYDDVKSGKVADPRVKPPLPPKAQHSKDKPPKRPPKTKKAL